jgi:hypothetical protein
MSNDSSLPPKRVMLLRFLERRERKELILNDTRWVNTCTCYQTPSRKNTERMQPPEASNVITGHSVCRDGSCCAQWLRQLRARYFVGRISLNVAKVVQYQDLQNLR